MAACPLSTKCVFSQNRNTLLFNHHSNPQTRTLTHYCPSIDPTQLSQQSPFSPADPDSIRSTHSVVSSLVSPRLERFPVLLCLPVLGDPEHGAICSARDSLGPRAFGRTAPEVPLSSSLARSMPRSQCGDILFAPQSCWLLLSRLPTESELTPLPAIVLVLWGDIPGLCQ